MRFRRFVPLLVLLLCGCRTGSRDAVDELDLATLLACNDRAVGGEALRQLRRIEYDLEIVEPEFAVRATYVADRRGTARIDLYKGGERVFSEGWDGTRGWQLPQGATEPVPTSPAGGAAMRNSMAAKFWTLRDMAQLGHSIVWAADVNEVIPGTHVVKLTNEDGASSWQWIDSATCLVKKTRSFRAFHPDVNPDERWIENWYLDYREDNGVTRAWTTLNVDLVSGDTVGRTRILAVRADGGR